MSDIVREGLLGARARGAAGLRAAGRKKGAAGRKSSVLLDCVLLTAYVDCVLAGNSPVDDTAGLLN
jgi:hypothetical protein